MFVDRWPSNGLGKMSMCTSALLLGAYYYTWYGIGEQWQVFPRTWEPVLGEYHSADASTMATHHRWAREACLDFFAVSWGGDGTRSPGRNVNDDPAGKCKLADETGAHSRPICRGFDGTPLDPERGKTYAVDGWTENMLWWTPSGDVDLLIQRHLEVPNGVPMALMYEVRDVLGVGAGEGTVDFERGDNPRILEHHLLYAAEKYFMHPRYLKIDGRPVLFLYTLRDFRNFEKPLGNAIRKAEERIGTPLFTVGDMVWWSRRRPDQWPWREYRAINLAAVTAYNLYDWGQPERMGTAFAWQSARQHVDIASAANTHGIAVVPCVMAGYDDRKMRGWERPTVPRAEGTQYMRGWETIRWLLDCQELGEREGGGSAGGGRPLVMVNSFNEWHEGTQIEPSEQFGDSYLGWTRVLKQAAAERGRQNQTEQEWHVKGLRGVGGEGMAASVIAHKLSRSTTRHDVCDGSEARGMGRTAKRREMALVAKGHWDGRVRHAAEEWETTLSMREDSTAHSRRSWEPPPAHRGLPDDVGSQRDDAGQAWGLAVWGTACSGWVLLLLLLLLAWHARGRAWRGRGLCVVSIVALVWLGGQTWVAVLLLPGVDVAVRNGPSEKSRDGVTWELPLELRGIGRELARTQTETEVSILRDTGQHCPPAHFSHALFHALRLAASAPWPFAVKSVSEACGSWLAAMLQDAVTAITEAGRT